MYRTVFWTLWERERVGRFGRMALNHVKSSCQSRFDARYWMLGAGALGRPRGMEWGWRREGGSGWGTHVRPWWIHVNVWKNHYNIKKKKKKNVLRMTVSFVFMCFIY